MTNKIIKNSKIDDAPWSIVQNDLKDDFKSIIWNSWVKPLIFVEYTNFILIIETPSELVKNRIDNQYYDQIFFRAKRVFIGLNKIRFKVQKDKRAVHQKNKQNSIINHLNFTRSWHYTQCNTNIPFFIN